MGADFMPPTMAALCHGVDSLQLLMCVLGEPVGAAFSRDSSFRPIALPSYEVALGLAWL
jgi:hypothetical protein